MSVFVASIDGADFSGKTTIANLVVELLRQMNKGKNVEFKRTEVPSRFVTGSFTSILRSAADTVPAEVFALAYAADHLFHYYQTKIEIVENKVLRDETGKKLSLTTWDKVLSVLNGSDLDKYLRFSAYKVQEKATKATGLHLPNVLLVADGTPCQLKLKQFIATHGKSPVDALNVQFQAYVGTHAITSIEVLFNNRHEHQSR